MGNRYILRVFVKLLLLRISKAPHHWIFRGEVLFVYAFKLEQPHQTSLLLLTSLSIHGQNSTFDGQCKRYLQILRYTYPKKFYAKEENMNSS